MDSVSNLENDLFIVNNHHSTGYIYKSSSTSRSQWHLLARWLAATILIQPSSAYTPVNPISTMASETRQLDFLRGSIYLDGHVYTRARSQDLLSAHCWVMNPYCGITQTMNDGTLQPHSPGDPSYYNARALCIPLLKSPSPR